MPPHTNLGGGRECFITGSKSDESSNPYAQFSLATLWITDTLGSDPKIITLGNPGENSSARASANIKNKIFCVGSQNLGGSNKAALWLTDTLGSSVKSLLLEPQGIAPSVAYSIATNGADLFCVGQIGEDEAFSSTATLWIIDSLGAFSQPISLGTTGSRAFSINTSQDKLFVVGTQSEGLSNGRAALWITDVFGSSVQASYLSEKDSSAECIKVIGSKLFCGGKQANEFYSQATLWITDASGAFTQPVNLGVSGKDSVVHSITAIGNTLYCAGEEEGGMVKRAMLWITDTSGVLIKSIPLGSLDGDSFAYGIADFDNKLFLVGPQSTTSAQSANIWKTNSLGALLNTFNLGLRSNAFGIYIPKEATTLIQGIHKFSPNHFQKGL